MLSIRLLEEKLTDIAFAAPGGKWKWHQNRETRQNLPLKEIPCGYLFKKPAEFCGVDHELLSAFAVQALWLYAAWNWWRSVLWDTCETPWVSLNSMVDLPNPFCWFAFPGGSRFTTISRLQPLKAKLAIALLQVAPQLRDSLFWDRLKSAAYIYIVTRSWA